MKTLLQRLAILAALSMIAFAAHAQTTTITATIPTYANGVAVITFNSGGAASPFPRSVQGSIDTSGHFSLSGWNNTNGQYAPSTTTANICAGSAPSICYQATFRASGTTQDITALLANAPVPPTSAGAVTSLTGNQLLTDIGTSTLVTIGASEGLIATSNYPEYLATDLQVGSSSIIQIGSASMPDVLSCNTAGSGNCTQNGTLPKPWPWGITPTTKSVFGFGFNDLSNTGSSPTAAQLDQIGGQDLAYLMMLGIPDTQKLSANGNCTVGSGTFTLLGNPSWPAGTIRMTTAGTITCVNNEATYAGVIVYKSPGSNSTYSVTVTNAGNTYNLTDSTASTTLVQNTGAYTTAWGGAPTLYAIGQSGMTGGYTTITYNCISAGSDACVFVTPFFLNAGNNINSYPPVIQQLAPLQTTGGTCGGCISGHTDAELALVRTQQMNAALLLRTNGLNVSYFDPNATPNGANPSIAADMGKSYSFVVSAGGSGFGGSSVTPTFTGSCTIFPVAPAVPVSGGVLTTGTYTNITSGACTAAPTVVFAGGSGYTATAAYILDSVHFNQAAGQRVAQMATHLLSSAANTSDHFLPTPPAPVTPASAAGPHAGASAAITGNGDVVIFSIVHGNSAAATCEVSYPDVPGTGRIGVASFALSAFVAGGVGPAPNNLLTPFGHYEYSPGSPSLGTPHTTFNGGTGLFQFIIPITNYVSGTEFLYAACTTDGNPNSVFTMFPAGGVSGSASALTISPAW